MNFLVWKRGLRGPEASLDELDPRTQVEVKSREHLFISIVPLTDDERGFKLDALKLLHPCPAYEV